MTGPLTLWGPTGITAEPPARPETPELALIRAHNALAACEQQRRHLTAQRLEALRQLTATRRTSIRRLANLLDISRWLAGDLLAQADGEPARPGRRGRKTADLTD
jgi:hypothetical protein